MFFAVQKFYIFIESNFNFVVSRFLTCYCFIGRQDFPQGNGQRRGKAQRAALWWSLSALRPVRARMVRGPLPGEQSTTRVTLGNADTEPELREPFPPKNYRTVHQSLSRTLPDKIYSETSSIWNCFWCKYEASSFIYDQLSPCHLLSINYNKLIPCTYLNLVLNFLLILLTDMFNSVWLIGLVNQLRFDSCGLCGKTIIILYISNTEKMEMITLHVTFFLSATWHLSVSFHMRETHWWLKAILGNFCVCLYYHSTPCSQSYA